MRRSFLFYWLMVGSLMLMFSFIPLVVVAINFQDTPWDMYFNLYSQGSSDEGLCYTIVCSAAFILSAIKLKPASSGAISIDSFSLGRNIKIICFISGFLGLNIDLVLNGLLGAAPSGLISERPLIATILGYLSKVLSWGFPVLFIDELISSRKISKKSTTLMTLYLISTALAGSRAGLVSIYLIAVCGLAYPSPLVAANDAVRNCRRNSGSGLAQSKLWLLLSAAAFLSVIIGQLIKYHGETYRLSGLLTEGLIRFYLNNVALYLAIEDSDKVYGILMDNEPAALVSQFLSIFGVPREIPSSYRLLEWWGGRAEPMDSGHYAGYAYGWLGLSYGLFGWFGVVFVGAVFYLYLSILRYSARGGASLYKRLIFIWSAQMLFEFFTNLGLDNYVEKLFKSLICSILFSFFVVVVTSFSRRASRAYRIL
jgi:hypothetical protein